jgi:hypothetical protein
MPNDLGLRDASLPIEAKWVIAAYHEAGHIVIAAVMGVPLRPEGMMVDTEVEGLACYCKEPKDSDDSRERVMLATFAGCFAQDRYCKDHGYPQLEYLARIWSLDWNEARGISTKLSDAYLAGRGIGAAQEAIEKRSETLVGEKWPVIEAVASALLAKEWEPVKPLKSGSVWAKGTTAKYLLGDEVVQLMEQCGITAVCVSEC